MVCCNSNDSLPPWFPKEVPESYVRKNGSTQSVSTQQMPALTLAERTRDANWQGKAGTTKKISGYVINTGIILLFLGCGALVTTAAMSYFKGYDPLIRKILLGAGMGSLPVFAASIALSILLSNSAHNQVEKAVFREFEYRRIDPLYQCDPTDRVALGPDFMKINAPRTENRCLLGLMDMVCTN